MELGCMSLQYIYKKVSGFHASLIQLAVILSQIQVLGELLGLQAWF